MLVAKAADAVLAPAIGPAARVIMREMGPRIAVGAVILAHRPPLAIADIGPPAPPRRTLPGFLQPAAFCGLRNAVRASAAASSHYSPPNCRRGRDSCATGRRWSSSRGTPRLDSSALRTHAVPVLHYGDGMRHITARDANQHFAKVLS